MGLGSAAAAACCCLTSSSFRALFAESRTKETPSAPTNQLEFIAGVSSKSAQRRLGGCAPEAPPRQRAAASQSWTPAIVVRRRGRRRRAMRLPTGRKSPDVCPLNFAKARLSRCAYAGTGANTALVIPHSKLLISQHFFFKNNQECGTCCLL